MTDKTMPSTNVHHPVFDRFVRNAAIQFAPSVHGGGDLNFLGVHIPLEVDAPRNELEYWSGRCGIHDETDPSYPCGRHEDYFEYVDLLSAIDATRGHFVMCEVGAGYGRWLLNAAQAIRRQSHRTVTSYELIGIEADPARAAMLVEQMRRHDVSNFRLIEKAAAKASGVVEFKVNATPSRFGGMIIDDERDERSGRQLPGVEAWVQKEEIIAEPLSQMLTDVECIDFMNIDIQNAEIDVVPSETEFFDRKVRRVHVGTHSLLADTVVSEVFDSLGWIPVWAFPWRGKVNTPYGAVQFMDGIRSYVNPRLV